MKVRPAPKSRNPGGSHKECVTASICRLKVGPACRVMLSWKSATASYGPRSPCRPRRRISPPASLAASPVPAPPATFEPIPRCDLQLLPPVTPSKILCVGRNYRDHAAELGNEVPKEPLLFLKPPSSLLAPKGVVRIPAISTRVDYEGELGIVIGRRCYKIGPDEDVRPYIRGYVCGNAVHPRAL